MNRLSLLLTLGLAGTAWGQQSDRAPNADAVTDTIPPSWIVQYPDHARDSIRSWLAATAPTDSAGAAALLARAEQVGADYARVWGDSFPLLDVHRFGRWSPERRAQRLRADSLRKAGNAALGRAGLAAALADWRKSLAVATTLADTATMAAALGNIGAGFYGEARLDSASRYFMLARRLAGIAGDGRTRMNAVGGLASVSKDRGEYHAATVQYTEALELRRQIGDYRGVAADANNLGLIAAATGDLPEARRRHTEALVTARDHGLDVPAAAALINLGALASSQGDDLTAERRYDEALAVYRQLDDPADQALALRNLGLIEAGRGNYPAAAGRYRAALDIFATTGPVESTVGTRLDLSQVFAAMGSLDRADRQLGLAEREARKEGLSPVTEGRLRLARGDLALQFNRPAPARESYRAGLLLLRKAKDPAGEAAALAALGSLSLMEEDFATAREMLGSAAVRQRSLGDGRSAAFNDLLGARATLALGDTDGARRMVATAVDTLRHSGDRIAVAWALCQVGELERAAGLPLAAEASYRRGLERLGRRPATDVAVCLYAGLGQVLRARGAGPEAIAELELGIAAVELAAGQVSGAGRRADFLTDKWALYTDLALAQRAIGHDSAAFATSERLRARQTLALIARGPGAAPLAAAEPPRLSALRHQITGLMDLSTAHETPVALRGPDALEQLPNRRREALTQAEDAYAALLDSLEGAGGTRTPVVATAPPSWHAIAARLPADEVLIEYLVTDSAAVAFVIGSGRLTAVDLPVSGAELTTEVDFVRGTLAATRTARGGFPWQAPLRRLQSQLIAPIEAAGLLRDKHRLLIVPQRELHYFPFAALLGSGAPEQYLIQRFDIGYVSSAAVWLTLTSRAPTSQSGGLLALAPRQADLPGASAEVAAIAALYGSDATVLTGDRATSQALAAAAPNRSIIHLASLGVLNKHNPQFSYVALAPGGGSDGRLEVHDVARLSLNARLVVLSACQTGLGSGRVADVPPGDDWVGLVQAFQSAGARNVLATLWPVDDRATAELMKRFYAELRTGKSEVAALAMAQRGTLSSSQSLSPFYWAGFVMDGGL